MLQMYTLKKHTKKKLVPIKPPLQPGQQILTTANKNWGEGGNKTGKGNKALAVSKVT